MNTKNEKKYYDTSSSNNTWISATKKLKSSKREIPSYATMETNVLYYPFVTKFPLVDQLYKDENGMIIGIQITTSSKGGREITNSEVALFYDQIKLDHSIPITYVFVPLPALARKFKIEYNYAEFIINFEVWELPENFYNDDVSTNTAAVQQASQYIQQTPNITVAEAAKITENVETSALQQIGNDPAHKAEKSDLNN